MKKRINFCLEEEVIKRLQNIADEYGTTLTSALTIVLKEHEEMKLNYNEFRELLGNMKN